MSYNSWVTLEQDAEPIRLNCPYCGRPLAALTHQHGMGTVYRCRDHGRFWFDDLGRLRDELPVKRK